MRVLIADDRARVRFALRVLLERQPGYEIVGEASSAHGLTRQIASNCPDLLLLDWGLPGLLKAFSIDAMRRACPGMKVIVLSGQPEAEKEALTAGASAFVNKTDAPERLLTAIQSHGCSQPHVAEEDQP